MVNKKDIKKEKVGAPPRPYILQSEIPHHSLREALTVAQAITDNFAGQPTSPHQVAIALDISPTSSGWRSLSGSAVAYSLTSGGYNSKQISLQELGRRITAPTEVGDDLKAKAEAALKPKVFAQFFGKYNRAKFPPDNIAKNVLQHDFQVPPDRLDEVLLNLKDNGAFVGFLHQTTTGPFVSTEDLAPSPVTLPSSEPPEDEKKEQSRMPAEKEEPPAPPLATQKQFRVFISHGKNKDIVAQVKDLLDVHDIQYEVVVEEETTAIPVVHKVLQAMRKCSAGIMIVTADDEKAAETGAINNNVLIEIGSAFVLYDQRVILLWDKRLRVPSNLQGLYRCEFEGNDLTFATGTKLAKAIKGFRKTDSSEVAS